MGRVANSVVAGFLAAEILTGCANDGRSEARPAEPIIEDTDRVLSRLVMDGAMSDFGYDLPEDLVVQDGQEVVIHWVNEGSVVHDVHVFPGNQQALVAELAVAESSGEHRQHQTHAPGREMLSLQPNETGDMEFTARMPNKPGLVGQTVTFYCLQAGHLESGMWEEISVTS